MVSKVATQNNCSIVAEIGSIVTTFKDVNKFGKLTDKQLSSIIANNIVKYGGKKALNGMNKVVGESLQKAGFGDNYLGYLARVSPNFSLVQ